MLSHVVFFLLTVLLALSQPAEAGADAGNGACVCVWVLQPLRAACGACGRPHPPPPPRAPNTPIPPPVRCGVGCGAGGDVWAVMCVGCCCSEDCTCCGLQSETVVHPDTAQSPRSRPDSSCVPTPQPHASASFCCIFVCVCVCVCVCANAVWWCICPLLLYSAFRTSNHCAVGRHSGDTGYALALFRTGLPPPPPSLRGVVVPVRWALSCRCVPSTLVNLLP